MATSTPVSAQRLATCLPVNVVASNESFVLDHGRTTAQSLKGLDAAFAFLDLAINIATA
ncbi:MAG: hypothetical protein OXK76_14040 [Gammaproteobacteria bacterium]|nr:hypothetical protein [Gammaproteobacteria bacterium]